MSTPSDQYQESMLISAVNALTCNMDLIAWIDSRYALPIVRLHVGVGRSKDTGVLPVEGVACVHAM